MRKTSVLADLGLLLVALIWGMGFSATQYAIGSGLSAAMILLLRFSVAALAMAFVLALMMLALPAYADSRIFALAGVVVGAAVYLLMLLLTGAVTPADMKIVPGGAKLTRLIRRMKIWR